jgi:hypothetical protein
LSLSSSQNSTIQNARDVGKGLDGASFETSGWRHGRPLVFGGEGV